MPLHPPECEQARNQKDREEDCGEQAGAQIVSESARNETDEGRPAGAAEVSRQCEKGKQCGSSSANLFCGDAEGSGPEDSD